MDARTEHERQVEQTTYDATLRELERSQLATHQTITPDEQAIIDAQLTGQLPMFLSSRAALNAYRAMQHVTAKRYLMDDVPPLIG